MKPLFTAEVFDKIWLDEVKGINSHGNTHASLTQAEKERIAIVANAVVEKWLKRGKKVYSHGSKESWFKHEHKYKDTHEARLVAVRKIKK